MGKTVIVGLHRRALKRLLAIVSPRARRARMARFVELMRVQPHQRILDLGGVATLWRFVAIPLDITIVNLDEADLRRRQNGPHRFTYQLGDATDLAGLADNSFDIVFSNSCIEHVGPKIKQEAFCWEVRRLAPSYFVQTPAPGFPIEAHTGLPLWWWWPRGLRQRLTARWHQNDPAYAAFIDETRPLSLRQFRILFPDASIHREKLMGFTKSYAAWRRGPADAETPR